MNESHNSMIVRAIEALKETRKPEPTTQYLDESEKSRILSSFINLESLTPFRSEHYDLVEIDLSNLAPLLPKSGKLYESMHEHIFMENYKSMLVDATDAAKPDSWLIIWIKVYPHMCKLYTMLEELDWDYCVDPAIWAKITRNKNRTKLLRHEEFIYAKRGSIKLNRPRIDSYMYSDTNQISLKEDILTTFVPKNANVLAILNPIPTTLAAINMSMNITPVGSDEDYTRLAKNLSQPTPFDEVM